MIGNNGEEIPYGLCHCGCGAKTNPSGKKAISANTGEPRLYLNGHANRIPLHMRFWSKVDKTGDCWIWKAGKDSGGYGTISARGINANKAHRVSWWLTFGEIPKGLNVLHKCDNPPCVNPDHLFLGTQKDNMQDCSKKGRINPKDQRGEKHAMNVLTNQKVFELRRLRKETNLSFQRIAKMNGISTMTAYRAITGKSWGHI